MIQVFKRTLSRSLRLIHIIIAVGAGFICARIVADSWFFGEVPGYDFYFSRISIYQHIAMFVGINGIWLIGFIANVFPALVAEEVHEGTLRMLLAKSNTRNSIFLGKMLGAVLATFLLLLLSISVYCLSITVMLPDGSLAADLLKYIPCYLLYGAMVGAFFSSLGLLLGCIFKRALIGQFILLLIMLVSVLGIPFARLFTSLASDQGTGIPYLFDVNYHLSTLFRWCIELKGSIDGSRSYIEMLSYFMKLFGKVYL
ncbi:MAG: ABC transporter permease subunit, partial [Erysipelotrichaceae bacterium]|nr:ABC transporter permease subunit [Erysipelotrichaceae bacterium]